MFYRIIEQCIRSLETLETYLDKAEELAKSKGFDIEILMRSRLAPDQRDFIYQVQSACDYVKAAAGRLAGAVPPVHEDNERTLAEARERIRKTLTYARGFSEASYQNAEALKIGVPWAPGRVTNGIDYVLQIIIPNVYFHITTAYAILRHNGVSLTKGDYLGHIAFEPATSP